MGTTLPNLRYLGLSRTRIAGRIPASLDPGLAGCAPVPRHARARRGPANHRAPERERGGRVACSLWLIKMTGLSGAIPMGLCNATYNELYLKGSAAYGSSVLRVLR